MQSKSSKNNDKWRTVALQDQVAMLSKRVVELEEEAAAKSRGSPIKSQAQAGSPVLRSSLRKGATGRYSTPSPSIQRESPRVDLDEKQMYPDNHELLSKSDDDDEEEDAANVVTPALPRSPMSNEKDKSKSKSRFGFGKKSSKGRDDGSQSTSNYDF
ncbi:hypothetical protein ACHAWT_010885 [Skeletonema menzelii]